MIPRPRPRPWLLVVAALLTLAVGGVFLLWDRADTREADRLQARADSTLIRAIESAHRATVHMRETDEELARLDQQLDTWVERANNAAARHDAYVEQAARGAARTQRELEVALEAARVAVDSVVENEVTPLRVSLGIVQREVALLRVERRELKAAVDTAMAAAEDQARAAVRWEGIAKRPHLGFRASATLGAAAGATLALVLVRVAR